MIQEKIIPESIAKIEFDLELFNSLNYIEKTIYVYCDIIKFKYVGDSSNQLLRTVNIENTLESKNEKYTMPHYVSLSKNVIDSIHYI